FDGEPNPETRYRWNPVGFPAGLAGADGVFIKDVFEGGRRLTAMGKAEGGKGSMPFVGNSVKLDLPGSRDVHIQIDPEAGATRYAGLTFTVPCVAEIRPDGTLLVNREGLKAIDPRDNVWKSRSCSLEGKAAIVFFPTGETMPNPVNLPPPPSKTNPDPVNPPPPSKTNPDPVNPPPPSKTNPDPVNPPPPSKTNPDLVNPPPAEQRKELTGHSGFVVSLAFTKDGKTLVSGSFDSTAKVWDVATRKVKADLIGHKGPVVCVALTQDETTLATASHDLTVKIWDMATGKEKVTLQGHEGYVSSVVWAADGKTLFSGSHDRTVKVWDVAAKKELATLKGEEGPVHCIALSRDGKTLAVGGAHWPGSENSILGKVTLWDVASGKEAAHLKGHKGIIKALAFTPDGSTLVSSSEDGTVKIWDLAERVERFSVEQKYGVRSIALSSDGKTLVSTNGFGEVKLWDVATGTGQPLKQSFGGADGAVAMTHDGRLLALALAPGSGNIYLADISSVK
ncbi:MAG: WD40 repeat domain-containing protein, partial [Gemmataceae bacterium]